MADWIPGTPIGTFINFITLVTLIGIQGLLAWLTIQYYIQVESITGLNGRFEDEVQVLIAFEITWGTILKIGLFIIRSM